MSGYPQRYIPSQRYENDDDWEQYSSPDQYQRDVHTERRYQSQPPHPSNQQQYATYQNDPPQQQQYTSNQSYYQPTAQSYEQPRSRAEQYMHRQTPAAPAPRAQSVPATTASSSLCVQQVEKILASRCIVMIGQEGCPFCRNAEEMIMSSGLGGRYRKVDPTKLDYNAHACLNQGIDAKTGGYDRVPKIFIGSTFIGGLNELEPILKNPNYMDIVASYCG